MSATPVRVRSRILIAALLPAILVAVALAGVLLERQYRSLDDAMQARARAEARQLASAAEFGVFANSLETLNLLTRSVRAGDPDIVAVTIRDTAGLPLAASGVSALTMRPALRDEESVFQHGMLTVVIAPIRRPKLPVDDVYSWESRAVPVPDIEGFVILEMSRKSLETERSRQMALGAFVAAAGLGLAAWLAARIALGVMRPIFRISDVVNRIGRGDLSARVESDARGAMPGLEAGINGMAERLGRAQEHLVSQIEAATGALRQRTDEAERANMAKMRFLAAASHDLRQPIHAQGLFLDVLSRTELDAVQRDLVAKMAASVDASAEMLNTLLDFSRIEAGVVEPQVRPFRLQPLLDKIDAEFGPLAVAKGLVFRTREAGAAVQSDPALVELVTRNLVSNAIRYTERGGVLVACRRRGEAVWLEVWDTGIGIAPEQQQEVFREFHQLGNPERDRHKGLGLGLAIADGLTRTLGHRLWLESVPGRGSVFRLALPLAQSTFVDDRVEAIGGATSSIHARVLVIDDDETVREGMARLLEDWGCTCVAVETIEEALAAARRQRPDVVISDYRLREQRTGSEAIAALRAELGADLPALLVTGDTAPERLRESAAANVPLLHKPVSAQLLHRHLVALLSR